LDKIIAAPIIKKEMVNFVASKTNFMKTSISLLSLFSSLVLFSCTSSENKVNSTVKKTDTVPTEQVSGNNVKDTVASPQNINNEATVNLVKQTLAAMFKDDLSKNLIEEPSKKFKLFEYDLNDDQKKEIFVGLTGPYFCGSGGCTLLLLNSQGELITKFTVTAAPILIADTNSNGWKDLILHSNGKDHLVKFNGKKYPSNPSVQPVYTSTPNQNLVSGLNVEDQPYSW